MENVLKMYALFINTRQVKREQGCTPLECDIPNNSRENIFSKYLGLNITTDETVKVITNTLYSYSIELN